MGEGVPKTAAIEVNDAFTLGQRKDDAPIEGVAAFGVEQADASQEIERIALGREMMAQASPGGVADAQFLDQGWIAQSALLEITQRLRVARELLLIKSSGRLKHSSRVDCRRALLLKIGKALAEGEMTGQLDKANQIATLAAAVAVEEIFVDVDIERRPSFRVQRTESYELGGAGTCRAGRPVLLPQVIEQRSALFEFFDVLAHGVVSVRKPSLGEGRQHSQARMVGGRK